MQKRNFRSTDYVRFVPPEAGGDENHSSCRVGYIVTANNPRTSLVKLKSEAQPRELPNEYLRHITPAAHQGGAHDSVTPASKRLPPED